MATFTRKNAWNNSGTFSNTDLLWYAKAVGVMQSRSLDDPTSWWFFAAMHGAYINGASVTPPGSLNWANIPGLPKVPTTPLPATAVINQYWDQCQHASWFFPPWHRGYLYAIENVLRGIIVELEGPADWALPYWNYFGPQDQHLIPPAFTQQTLDGNPNPLFVTARYGPTGNGDIYVNVSRVSQKCQTTSDYTGITPDYYGGGKTGFAHSGKVAGALEYNPHNGVHGQVGGRIFTNMGLMSDPGTAALDPIFYLHHCNIDRMWAAWNNAGKKNPVDQNWINGPTAVGGRRFYMPKPDKSPWQFTPDMVKDTSQLDYTYADLALGITLPVADKNVMRLLNFGIQPAEIKNFNMDLDANTELIGANNGAIALNATGARTTVRLDTKGLNTMSKSIGNIFANKSVEKSGDLNLPFPDEVYLELEGIKGNADANEYSVTVNQHYVGHVFLFGLSKASMQDGEHGGEGLNIAFNITNIIDELHLNAADLDTLDVLIQPSGQTFENDRCTIDRVSIYRKGQSTDI